ncbi:MAG: hypothetical protein HYX21_03210 [Candidatus Yanofskybacteria bacterium]|nr:hypothetical protein [Candidatus Yanofskybacteria bacterium]
METTVIAIFTVVSALMLAGLIEARKYKATHDMAHQHRHKICMRSAFFFMMAGVLLLEASFIYGFLESGKHDFLWFHLSLAFPAAVLMGVLAFWKDGTKYRFHGKLGYVCFVLWLGALITGIFFLYT